MRPRRIICLAASAAILLPALADAGIARWLRPSTYSAAAANLLIDDEALVVTPPARTAGDEREVVVLTAFGPERLRFTAGDRGRVDRRVRLGTRLELLEVVRLEDALSGPIVVPTRWNAQNGDDGNPFAGPLGSVWPEILSIALRDSPELLAFAFSRHRGELALLEQALPQVHDQIDGLLGVAHPLPAAPQPPVECEPNAELELERALQLMAARAQLLALVRMFDQHPDGDHHGAGAIARDAADLIDAALSGATRGD